MAQNPDLLVRSGQAYLGRFPASSLGSRVENPNLMDPDQLSALSTNLMKIFSLTLTGRWVNTIALQKLSTLKMLIIIENVLTRRERQEIRLS